MEGLRDWHALRAGGHTGLHGGALWGAPSSHTASGRCGAAARAGGGSRTAEAFEARARRAFERYDAEGSGSLTREGVKLAFMELLGYKPTRYELAVLFGHAHTPTLAASFPPTSSYSRSGAAGGGAHGAGEDAGPATGGYAVGWEEFLAAVRQRAEGEDEGDMMRLAFKAADRRSAGFLTLDDAKRVFQEVAPHVRERLVEQIFFEFDSDHDGRLTMAQFESLWRKGA